jgi:hypothetical protein
MFDENNNKERHQSTAQSPGYIGSYLETAKISEETQLRLGPSKIRDIEDGDQLTADMIYHLKVNAEETQISATALIEQQNSGKTANDQILHELLARFPIELTPLTSTNQLHALVSLFLLLNIQVNFEPRNKIRLATISFTLPCVANGKYRIDSLKMRDLLQDNDNQTLILQAATIAHDLIAAINELNAETKYDDILKFVNILLQSSSIKEAINIFSQSIFDHVSSEQLAKASSRNMIETEVKHDEKIEDYHFCITLAQAMERIIDSQDGWQQADRNRMLTAKQLEPQLEKLAEHSKQLWERHNGVVGHDPQGFSEKATLRKKAIDFDRSMQAITDRLHQLEARLKEDKQLRTAFIQEVLTEALVPFLQQHMSIEKKQLLSIFANTKDENQEQILAKIYQILMKVVPIYTEDIFLSLSGKRLLVNKKQLSDWVTDVKREMLLIQEEKELLKEATEEDQQILNQAKIIDEKIKPLLKMLNSPLLANH